jgi:ribosomal protein L16 Arg81 hydroxylase
MKRTRLICYLAVAAVLSATPAWAQDVDKFSEEMSHFYLHPTKQRYELLQQEADKYAASLRKKGNQVDLLTAAFIACAAQRYHWGTTGRSEIATKAREIANGQSQIAKYVRDDQRVDPTKLDIWWVDFFATGDKEYLEKILRRAEKLHAGQRAAQMLVPFAASWSFKSNCKQHAAVLAYAKDCLKTNRFPQKNDFLQDCVHFAEKR